MRALGDVALRLHRFPKPTIAKVGGVAAGAGMSMALGCDLIVASESARFSQIFAKRGLSVDFGASWLLPRLIGLHRAKELAFFADIIDARQAAEFGLVNRIVPADQLDAFVDDWARKLAVGATVGPLDDQDHAEQFVEHLHGSGARGRVALPGGQLQHRGHPGGARRVLPEARTELQGALSRLPVDLSAPTPRYRQMQALLWSSSSGSTTCSFATYQPNLAPSGPLLPISVQKP